MSLDTANKIVDFAMGITPPNQSTDFCFFGGEPLLCIDLMQDIIGHIREQERVTGNCVRISITTNGTIITQSILDFLAREHIDLCISIDGPADVHDQNRRFHDGRGSFTPVLKNLQEALRQLDRVQVNAVYGPDTIELLPEILSFFIRLGLSAIHLNPDIRAYWPENIYPIFLKTYIQLADHYIHSYQSGLEVALNLIDSKVILFLKGGYASTDKCGMGERELAFAPSGNMYPCERFIGDDNNGFFCLGNIHTGVDPARRCSVLKGGWNINVECKTCGLKDYCMNWCGCTNYYLTGSTNLVGPVLCASERAAIRAAEYVATTMSDVGNELFMNHFFHYVHNGGRYQ
jgi:uncharacterized protein